jgi:ubiquinone/menaquinone biosynthesis C-methylase UbiE
MIPQFLERSESADAVVGSRYLETGSLPGWSALRKSLTSLGHVLTKNMLGISQDATGAFRAYNLTKIRRDLFDLVQSNGYAFFFESMLVLERNGLAIAEIPITLPARTYGSSKMSVDEVRRSVATLLTLFIQDQTNPGRFRPGKTSVVLDPALVDPQNWNEYWDAKSAKSAAVYDLAAALYRNTILKRHLESTISREFQPGARLLHAGCGGGPVDANLHQQVRITAVDISPSALDFYRRSNPDAEDVRHADIMDLPFPNGSFDGAYNLGVVEHFDRPQLTKVFSELRRVLKPNGKLVVFWPHARGTSVTALGAAHWLLNDVLHKNVRLHPPEVSLVHSAREAADLLATGGFDLKSYEFGPKDLFVQAKIVATRQ